MPVNVLVEIARFGVLILTIVATIVAIRKPMLRNKIEVKFIFRSDPKDDEQKKNHRRKSHKNKKGLNQ